jgi:hypothetical protein
MADSGLPASALRLRSRPPMTAEKPRVSVSRREPRMNSTAERRAWCRLLNFRLQDRGAIPLVFTPCHRVHRQKSHAECVEVWARYRPEHHMVRVWMSPFGQPRRAYRRGAELAYLAAHGSTCSRREEQDERPVSGRMAGNKAGWGAAYAAWPASCLTRKCWAGSGRGENERVCSVPERGSEI